MPGEETRPPQPTRSDRRKVVRDVLMVALAVGSLYIPVLQDQTTDPRGSLYLLLLDLAIVAVFWAEYLWRLTHRPKGDRRAFVAANWYDLPGLIPILPGMEGLAGVRILRLLRLMRILRLLGLLRRFHKVDRAFHRFLHRSKLQYIALLALALILGIAAAERELEPETFRSYEDAVWFAIVTATTVGYGDLVPKTTAGRSAAAVLLVLGVGLIGTFAATLSSYLVERHEEREDAPPGGAQRGDLPGALERLARLREQGHLSEAEFASAKRRLLE